MSSTFGEKIKISIFGESHGEAIGVVIDGLKAGFPIDFEKLDQFMARRAPGRGKVVTSRKEGDKVKILSGVFEGRTCGTPLCGVIFNENKRSSDYDAQRVMPRPSHGDFPAHVKHNGFEDYRGGGHMSGRLTAPLCIAGGILLQVLEDQAIEISAEIVELGGKTSDFEAVALKAKEDGDSVGGIIKCTIKGLPVGVGEPIFDGVEGVISKAVFGIPGVKGIEFGSGFEGSRLLGSQNNDEFYIEDGKIKTKTNNHGGILGGMTSGMDIVFRVALKPTPSILKEQNTVNYESLTEEKLSVRGRHDPSIVFRAVPCVEAAAALAICQLLP